MLPRRWEQTSVGAVQLGGLLYCHKAPAAVHPTQQACQGPACHFSTGWHRCCLFSRKKISFKRFFLGKKMHGHSSMSVKKREELKNRIYMHRTQRLSYVTIQYKCDGNKLIFPDGLKHTAAEDHLCLRIQCMLQDELLRNALSGFSSHSNASGWAE